MILTERARGSINLDDWTDFSGTITSGGAAQILLPQQMGRVAFYFANNSSANLTIQIGPPPVSITLTNGVITAVSVSDNGLGWLFPPTVELLGGVFTGNFNVQPGSPNSLAGGNWPGQPAQIIANAISGGALNGFSIVNGGSGYKVAPTARLVNQWPQGGGGAATPSATAGMPVAPGAVIFLDSSVCPTSAINVFGGTTSQAFTCKVVLA